MPMQREPITKAIELLETQAAWFEARNAASFSERHTADQLRQQLVKSNNGAEFLTHLHTWLLSVSPKNINEGTAEKLAMQLRQYIQDFHGDAFSGDSGAVLTDEDLGGEESFTDEELALLRQKVIPDNQEDAPAERLGLALTDAGQAAALAIEDLTGERKVSPELRSQPLCPEDKK